MATVVPKTCIDMVNTDVLSVPGAIEQPGPTNFRARRVVLGIYDESSGPLLLPDGSELTIPPDTMWALDGVVALTAPPAVSSGKADHEIFSAGVRRNGTNAAAIDDSNTSANLSISIVGDDVVRISFNDLNDHRVGALVNIVEVDM